MSKRRTHSPEFKARVAMEAISGRKTLQEIAADHAVHPIQVSQWKKQLLEGASDLFSRGKKTQAKDESQAKEAELFQLMVLAMATISGALLVLYATTLRAVVPDAVGHLIAASLVSIPAALLVARLMVPPGTDDTATEVESEDPGLRYESSIDAIVKGTKDGMELFLAVIAVIITVFALVALVDGMLAALPLVEGAPLSLKRLLGWGLAPLMWLIGVPWDEAQAAGGVMGTKAVLNEYVAYLELATLPSGTFSPRSLLIVTYALCGVANLASVGLLVSTIGTLCPERRAEAAGLGMKSWIAGNLTSAMTGAWIGLVSWGG
jgi:CNT family concentrative nucleoside transporter